MLSRSEALERQVHRIKELLERSSDDVTWNDHIPDPDNPSQLRQIDIAVRRGRKLTIVECRLSKRRQDVKWIEELIGRRESLGAETIIGVASAGFTTGAQKKAARHGVLLRDLRQLREEEIRGWGDRVSLVLYYYQYSDVTLSVGVYGLDFSKIHAAEVRRELESRGLIQAAFNAAAQQLEPLKLVATEDTRTIGFGVCIQPEQGVPLNGKPILEVCLEGKVCLASRPVSCEKVFRYGEPGEPVGQRKITVEQFSMGETSVVHHNDRIAVDIDLSDIELPAFAQIRCFRVLSAEDQEHESFAITNPQMLRVAGHLNLKVYALPITPTANHE
jgi:hypothetical protein